MNRQKIVVLGAVLVGGLLLSACYHNPKTVTQTGTVSSPSPDLSAISTGAVVIYSDSGFSPVEVSVKVGEKVEFKNQGTSVVEVNSGPHPTHTSFPVLNIGQIASGLSKRAVFNLPGTYKYHNHLDASHQGTIIVE